MEIVRIEILNPEAKKLLEDLASLHLIKFKEKDSYIIDSKYLRERLRTQKGSPPSLNQITKEVEAVRQKHYGR